MSRESRQGSCQHTTFGPTVHVHLVRSPLARLLDSAAARPYVLRHGGRDECDELGRSVFHSATCCWICSRTRAHRRCCDDGATQDIEVKRHDRPSPQGKSVTATGQGSSLSMRPWNHSLASGWRSSTRIWTAAAAGRACPAPATPQLVLPVVRMVPAVLTVPAVLAEPVPAAAAAQSACWARSAPMPPSSAR